MTIYKILKEIFLEFLALPEFKSFPNNKMFTVPIQKKN